MVRAEYQITPQEVLTNVLTLNENSIRPRPSRDKKRVRKFYEQELKGLRKLGLDGSRIVPIFVEELRARNAPDSQLALLLRIPVQDIDTVCSQLREKPTVIERNLVKEALDEGEITKLGTIVCGDDSKRFSRKKGVIYSNIVAAINNYCGENPNEPINLAAIAKDLCISPHTVDKVYQLVSPFKLWPRKRVSTKFPKKRAGPKYQHWYYKALALQRQEDLSIQETATRLRKSNSKSVGVAISLAAHEQRINTRRIRESDWVGKIVKATGLLAKNPRISQAALGRHCEISNFAATKRLMETARKRARLRGEKQKPLRSDTAPDITIIEAITEWISRHEGKGLNFTAVAAKLSPATSRRRVANVHRAHYLDMNWPKPSR